MHDCFVERMVPRTPGLAQTAAARAQPCTLGGDLGPELQTPQEAAQLPPCLPRSTYFLTESGAEARVQGLGWAAPRGPLPPAPASAASPRRTGQLPAARRRARSRSYPAFLNAGRFPQTERVQTCPKSKPCPLFHCGVRLGGAARGKRGRSAWKTEAFPHWGACSCRVPPGFLCPQ